MHSDKSLNIGLFLIIKIIIAFTTLFLIFIKVEFVRAQAGSMDLTFNTIDSGFGQGDGASNFVRAIAVQGDGKIIIGGDFHSYNGFISDCIARLTPEGNYDTTFQSGTITNGKIYTLSLQDDGKVIAGGDFTTYNGITVKNIMRLNSDGTLDTSFHTGSGFNSTVYSTTILNNGKILVTGTFTTFNGVTVNRLVCLNEDGTKDIMFNTGSGANISIKTVAVQDDNKLLLGGGFTVYNGNNVKYLARLNPDGTLDTTFKIADKLNNEVLSIAIMNDGRVIAGGNFTMYDSVSYNHLIRLNSDGILDTTFNIQQGADNNINTIRVLNNGKILIGGYFTQYAGLSRNHFFCINEDGTPDYSFDIGMGFDLPVVTSYLLIGGKILLGGDFTMYNVLPTKRITRLNINGDFDYSFNVSTGANDRICNVAYQNNNKIYIGGDFTSFNNKPRFRIARLHNDGSLDTIFNPQPGANATVRSISFQSNGKIIVCGSFSQFDHLVQNKIARLFDNGTVDSTFNTGTGFDGAVNAGVVQGDDKIIVGGVFSNFNGISRNNIARLNANGTLDTNFNPGTGTFGQILALALQQDGKIIIAGKFQNYNLIIRQRIARINTDGTLDQSFEPGTGANNDIETVAIQDDGKIVIGGIFTKYNGTNINRIARLNNDGTLDTSFHVTSGADIAIYQIVIDSNDRIIAGGNFTSYNGHSIMKLARINPDGDLDLSFCPGSSADKPIDVLAAYENRLLIGGRFFSYDGYGKNRLARISNCSNSSNSIFIDACNVYNSPSGNYSWSDTGIYYDTIPNSEGCDSLLLINLTVNTLDLTTSLNEYTITVNEPSASYQWIDCENGYSIIQGENNQSFTPSINGQYAVIVDKYSCSDTSSCVDISGMGLLKGKSGDCILFPNPVTQNSILFCDNYSFESAFRIYDNLGQIMLIGFVSNSNSYIDFSEFKRGVYYVKFDRYFPIVKIIKI